MHHIHISTGFMFVLSFLLLGLVAIVLAFIATIKRDRRERKHREDLADTMVRLTPTSTPFYERASVQSAPSSSAYTHNYTPVPPLYAAAPVYTSSHDPMIGFATGMLLGEALSSHEHTTVINDYSPPCDPSYDPPRYTAPDSSGFSYDSDPSYDTGPSSSGFDASW